ncbi:hypothetical protein ACFOSS_03035 [Pseudaeromonas sharmana]|uniref:Uncharacterized protein n=1 Tax=Pseudaeromonas sharmana TaxID=328412 RepID=A0ABV8CKS7_9GAMM
MKMPYDKPGQPHEPHPSRQLHAQTSPAWRNCGLLVALALIVITVLCQFPDWSRWIQQQNVASTPDGAARLGLVYQEKLLSHLLITRVVDNSELLRIDAQPDALYPMAVEKVLQDIRKINDQAQAQQGDNFKAVQYETAMWNDDIRIQLQTEVIYRSEYHDQLIIPIQHSDKIVKKEEAVISKLLDSLKGYGPQQLALYRREHSFLQP